jgi:hypothetical protein
MIVKSVMILLILLVPGICSANDVWVSAQPIQSVVYYQAPNVSFVPVLVQKEVLVNTWEFRPIVIPNFTIYQYQPIVPLYYHRPCWFRNSGPYYMTSPVVSPYRY